MTLICQRGWRFDKYHNNDISNSINLKSNIIKVENLYIILNRMLESLLYSDPELFK